MSVTADSLHAPLATPALDIAGDDADERAGPVEILLTAAATTVAIIVVATIGVLLALV